MNELVETLKAQIKTYEELLSILQREREAVILFNPEEIEKVAKEKDLALMKVRLYEEERLAQVNEIGKKLSLNEPITLERLAEATGDPIFHELRLKFLSLIQSIMELNEFNKVLIERSVRHINLSLSFLEKAGYLQDRTSKLLKA